MRVVNSSAVWPRMVVLTALLVAFTLISGGHVVPAEPRVPPYAITQSHAIKMEGRVVVMVDREEGATVYRVNFRPVPLPRLGDALQKAFDPKAPDQPAFVLFHDEIPLRVIFNVGGNLGKIGFERVSFYVFDDDKAAMEQVEFGPKVLQFSPSGPQPPYDDIRIPRDLPGSHPEPPPPPEKDKRLVIMVDRDKGATVYRVNSALVPFRRLPAALAKAFDPKAPDRPVFVLLHQEIPLGVIFSVGRHLGKIGFAQVSLYVFDDSKFSMQQVEFGPKVLHFSPSGPPEPGQQYDMHRPPDIGTPEAEKRTEDVFFQYLDGSLRMWAFSDPRKYTKRLQEYYEAHDRYQHFYFRALRGTDPERQINTLTLIGLLRLPEFEEASVALAQREPGNRSLQEAVAFYLHRIGRDPAKNLERLLSRLRILIEKPNDEIGIYWLGFVDSAEPARSLLRQLSKKSDGAVSELVHVALESLSLRCPERLTPPICKQDPWLPGK